MDENFIKRFWTKVNKASPDRCWEWRDHLSDKGYGKIRMPSLFGKKMKFAHRVAWEIENGPIPAGDGYQGMCVMHKCDNPACVNPNHLMLGTQKDNMMDMSKKKRYANNKGTSHPLAKLNDLQVRIIKHMTVSRAVEQKDIAKLFGVTKSTVSKISCGVQWSHIT